MSYSYWDGVSDGTRGSYSTKKPADSWEKAAYERGFQQARDDKARAEREASEASARRNASYNASFNNTSNQSNQSYSQTYTSQAYSGVYNDPYSSYNTSKTYASTGYAGNSTVINKTPAENVERLSEDILAVSKFIFKLAVILACCYVSWVYIGKRITQNNKLQELNGSSYHKWSQAYNQNRDEMTSTNKRPRHRKHKKHIASAATATKVASVEKSLAASPGELKDSTAADN